MKRERAGTIQVNGEIRHREEKSPQFHKNDKKIAMMLVKSNDLFKL